MKYIITEKQYKLLIEITIPLGVYETSVIKNFFYFVKQNLPLEKVIKSIRDYFESIVGQDMSKYDDATIKNYLSDLSYPFLDLKLKSKIFKNNDVISNLAYHISNNFLKIQESSFGLKYVKVKKENFITYYFFDSELDELIGLLEIEKYVEPFTPKNSYKVIVSSVDKHIKGMGYGKNIYLTVINDVGALFSDDVLYEESLNIWVNILPKYINNVGYINIYGDSYRITNKTKIPFDNVKRFYAIK